MLRGLVRRSCVIKVAHSPLLPQVIVHIGNVVPLCDHLSVLLAGEGDYSGLSRVNYNACQLEIRRAPACSQLECCGAPHAAWDARGIVSVVPANVHPQQSAHECYARPFLPTSQLATCARVGFHLLRCVRQPLYMIL